jgi:pyruvate dehydrogenase E1 component beta subunit
MTEATYRQAIALGIMHSMEADDRVFLIGEDVAASGGAFKLTEGIYDRFGPERALDTPISEQAIVGCAIGAAIKGLHPVAEIMFADFAAVCFDQIVNQLAKYRYMTDGQVGLPVTIRMATGAGGGFGAQHSQSAENWFLNVPGLKIVAPSTAADAYSFLRAAIDDPDPVLVFEHKALFNRKGPVRSDASISDLTRAAMVVRTGGAATIVAPQLMLEFALEAADMLSDEGISVEVIDPRVFVPLDVATICRSVCKTGRLVCVQEGPVGGSWAAGLVARVCADQLESLDAPPAIVGGDDTPIPYAGPMEAAWLPSPERIAGAIRMNLAY